ncbi:MAG: hypothetical protein EOM26_05195 [Alphaproteobacteria bacterium]|nr:hypothetical protein [Alphaproteobacteria bacterium]
MFLKEILLDAFVRPFSSGGLSRTYLATIVSVIGLSGVNLFLAFDYAGMGLGAIMSYFIVRYAFANIVFMPACFNVLKRFSFKAFCMGVMPLQIAVLGFFAFSGVPGSPWLISFLLTIVEMPFWVAFHIAMLLNTTDANRGNEVSLSDAGITVGSIAGLTLGGVALQFDLGPWVVLAGGIASFSGWAIIAFSLIRLEQEAPLFPPQEGKRSEWEVFMTDPVRALGTVMEGAFQTVTGILMPVLLKLLGAAGAAAGGLQAVMAGLKIVMSPLTGYLVNEGRGRDATLGALLKLLGWIPWLFVQAPWLVLVSSFFWTAGAHLFSNGLLSRWYNRGNLSTLSLREMMLGVGRSVAVVIGLPLLYGSVSSFTVFALAVTTLLVLASRLIRQRITRQGLVVAEVKPEVEEVLAASSLKEGESNGP